MRPVAVALILSVPQLAFAACVDVPAPGVPRSHRQAIAYALAADAGHDESPTDGQGLQVGQSQLNAICFTTFDPTGLITDQAMLDRFTLEDAARQAAATAEAQRQAAFETEVATNSVCTATLSEIDSRLDTLIDPVGNFAEVKTAMKIALKRIARCVRARAR